MKSKSINKPTKKHIVFLLGILLLCGLFLQSCNDRSGVSDEEVYKYGVAYYIENLELHGYGPSDSEMFDAAVENFEISEESAKQLFWEFKNSQP